ncbi:MAG: hypothetical protein Q8M76_03185 [Spirochaetaceae bacterium]|nr:hypothetical protein [Spirochaetaceae bacterium]
MTRGIEARTGFVSGRRIAPENQYLWDNLGYVDSGVTHIYAQAADKAMCGRAEDRYRIAYWRHFVSEDDGESWRDEGPAIVPRSGTRAYDGSAIWSGSVLPLADGSKLAAYTGLEEGKLALQSIALAVSDDGYGFRRVSEDRPLLSPELDYGELRDKGYYLGPRETLGNIEREADGTFLCLRDPFLFEDSGGTVHLFFGAKAMRGGLVVRAVGHAVLADPCAAKSAEILRPQFVPDGDEFNMLELPNVFMREGVYYLVVSTTNLAYFGQPDLQAEKMVRIYRSDRLDGDWRPYGDRGDHILLRPESRLYGLNILVDPRNSTGSLICRAFWVGENWLPPSLELWVGGVLPRLVCPLDLQ